MARLLRCDRRLCGASWALRWASRRGGEHPRSRQPAGVSLSQASGRRLVSAAVITPHMRSICGPVRCERALCGGRRPGFVCGRTVVESLCPCHFIRLAQPSARECLRDVRKYFLRPSTAATRSAPPQPAINGPADGASRRDRTAGRGHTRAHGRDQRTTLSTRTDAGRDCGDAAQTPRTRRHPALHFRAHSGAPRAHPSPSRALARHRRRHSRRCGRGPRCRTWRTRAPAARRGVVRRAPRPWRRRWARR